MIAEHINSRSELREEEDTHNHHSPVSMDRVSAIYRFKEPNGRREEVTPSLKRRRSLGSIAMQIRAFEKFPRFAVLEG